MLCSKNVQRKRLRAQDRYFRKLCKAAVKEMDRLEDQVRQLKSQVNGLQASHANQNLKFQELLKKYNSACQMIAEATVLQKVHNY